MGKRIVADDTENSEKAKRIPGKDETELNNSNGDDDMGEFEDAWAEDDDEDSTDEEIMSEQNDDDENEANDDEISNKVQAFLPSQSKLEPNEVLVADPTAYVMYHPMSVQWPCLSFDIIRDSLGNYRTTFPMTCMLVIGSQAENIDKNEITILKVSNLKKTLKSENAESSESDDDDDEEEDGSTDDNDLSKKFANRFGPVLESRSIPVQGGINRLRYHAKSESVASWHETGVVNIWDARPFISSLSQPGNLVPKEAAKPVYTIRSHKTEGYALAWSPFSNQLLSGDNDGKIYLTRKTNDNTWVTENMPFTSHTGSIEDIAFSPIEESVFASCGSDGTIRIWNINNKDRKCAMTIKASDTDVNVISWNINSSYLLASGSDDGKWSVWDMRQWKSSELSNVKPVAEYNFHKAPITSIEWHPSEESVIAVSSADDQLTLWDLSVELDQDEQMETEEDLKDIPSQLMFIHLGQKDIKEIHWHPQLPGTVVSTAYTGVDIFKTISV